MSENISDTEIDKTGDQPVDQSVDQSAEQNAYIRQLTMETMINQDLLRKIRYKKAKESQTIFKPNFKDQASEWLEQLLKDYDHLFPKYDIPCEIREGFDAFMKICNEHWKQHWETTKMMDLGMEMDTEWASDKLETKLDTKNENAKEISMLPIYMKFQHPVWNNGSFNHKHGKYNHPHLNRNHKKSSYHDNSQQNTLFPENMD
jgi:hypothetical protein